MALSGNTAKSVRDHLAIERYGHLARPDCPIHVDLDQDIAAADEIGLGRETRQLCNAEILGIDPFTPRQDQYKASQSI